MFARFVGFSAAALAALAFVGCASTGVDPGSEQRAGGPRPTMIAVYDFQIGEEVISENQAAIGKAVAESEGVSERQRLLAIGREATNALSEDLAEGLRALGFQTVRLPRGAFVSGTTLIVDGRFLNVDEGNRMKRIVIGLGAGGSAVDTQVQVYQGPNRRKLLEFTTHSDSGSLPGAAITMGAGAATGGITAGAAAAKVATTGIKEHRSTTAQMAGRSGDQAVAYLSEYFARQGWISAEDAKKAKRVE